VLLAAIAIWSSAAGDAVAAVEPDGFFCGQITPSGTPFLTLVFDSGGGIVQLTGFVSPGATGDPIQIDPPRHEPTFEAIHLVGSRRTRSP
jgi:hypothetical protein